jgi:integrase/recombinase XerC
MSALALTAYECEHVGALRFDQALDLFIADMRSQGRINSPATERSYRSVLDRHGEDVFNHDPRTIGREQVKRTLTRWPNPNSQRTGRAILVSFYDWTMEEGIRTTNPARMTRRPKRRPTTVYRLTRDEAAAMLRACQTVREVRAISLGICAGLRNAELRGLQGAHFDRPGFVHVSADIAKGGRERWVPVMAELLPVVEEIRRDVGPDEFVLPAQRWRDPSRNQQRVDLRKRPSSSQALRTLVMQVGERAGIKAHVHPHLLRHAFGDHIARYAGLKNAQALMGHASSGTTEGYTGAPTLDDLTASISGFSFVDQTERTFVQSGNLPGIPHEATTGIEPVMTPRLRLVRDDDYRLTVLKWSPDA